MAQIDEILQRYYTARIPTILWGPPGVGKTSTIEAFARRLGLKLIIPTVRTAEDFAVPVPSADGVRTMPVNDFIEAASLKEGIVFIDELSTLYEDAQAGILRFLDSGLVGGRRISPNVWRVCASNRPEDAVNGTYLRAPTSSRLAHVEFPVPPEEWAKGFASYWGNPPKIGNLDELAWGEERARVATFIGQWRPNLLVQIPRDEVAQSGPFPTPRTWDYGSRLAASLGSNPKRDEIVEAYATLVGEGAASEYGSWWSNARELPSPAEILAAPRKWPIPKRGDLKFAAILGAAVLASSRKDYGAWLACWEAIDYLAKNSTLDVLVPAVLTLCECRQEEWDYPRYGTRYLEPLLRAQRAGV
ncbi:MAG: ATP-binding protein [Candidatus Binatia bacterium]|nr:ATP-binding protein [Candidatus Binatia bacterium]